MKLANLAAAVVLGATTAVASAQHSHAGAQEDVAVVLQKYEAHLNSSDTKGVMTLFADDGVFMPQHSPSAVGRDAVRKAYEAVFKAIKLSVAFDVAEIQIISDNWAFARTNSEGSVTVLANGAKLDEANQELFLLRKQADGSWKIARYAFSTTKPPRN